LGEWLHVRQQNFVGGILTEVSEAGASVRLDTGGCVVQSSDHDRHAFSMESLLEITWQVI